jgi:hypothetical protein
LCTHSKVAKRFAFLTVARMNCAQKFLDNALVTYKNPILDALKQLVCNIDLITTCLYLPIEGFQEIEKNNILKNCFIPDTVNLWKEKYKLVKGVRKAKKNKESNEEENEDNDSEEGDEDKHTNEGDEEDDASARKTKKVTNYRHLGGDDSTNESNEEENEENDGGGGDSNESHEEKDSTKDSSSEDGENDGNTNNSEDSEEEDGDKHTNESHEEKDSTKDSSSEDGENDGNTNNSEDSEEGNESNAKLFPHSEFIPDDFIYFLPEGSEVDQTTVWNPKWKVFGKKTIEEVLKESSPVEDVMTFIVLSFWVYLERKEDEYVNYAKNELKIEEDVASGMVKDAIGYLNNVCKDMKKNQMREGILELYEPE